MSFHNAMTVKVCQGMGCGQTFFGGHTNLCADCRAALRARTRQHGILLDRQAILNRLSMFLQPPVPESFTINQREAKVLLAALRELRRKHHE